MINASSFDLCKVLKNTEREAAEKLAEKAEKFEARAIKKSKDAVRSKEKIKEKVIKEKPKKVFAEKKATEGNDDGTESSNLKRNARQAVKEETVHKEDTQSATFNKTEEDVCKPNEGKDAEKDKERKIRNKDRPAIQIYRPGSKRLTAQKQVSLLDYFLCIFPRFFIRISFFILRKMGTQKL